MKNVKWTNIHSNEVGYVKSISAAKKCFINTFDQAEARKFRSEAEAQKAIATLIEIGEAENNEFSIVEA